MPNKQSALRDNQSIPADGLHKRTDDRHRIGTDAKGRAHYADPILGAVWVTVNGELAHVEPTRGVERWVNYTTKRVGWDDCRYSTESTAEWLAGALTEVGE